MSVPAKLKKVLDKHLPVDTSSSRAIQRVAALFLGVKGTIITNEGLRALCTELNLFDYEGRAGRNTFGANFTVNMAKDSVYFGGDRVKGWKLTTVGAAEAKAIFENNVEPTKRRGGGVKAKVKKTTKKTAKKTAKKAKKTAKKTAKKVTPTPKASTPDDRAKRKAAMRRKKKRNLTVSASTTT